MGIEIRQARPGEEPEMQQIERLSGQQFRTVGLDSIADDEPPSVEELASYAREGRCWVAHDGDDLVGYAIAYEVDGNAHLEQVSVVPEHQGRGVGRMLVDVVKSWARAQSHSAVTLTTFADVPWNRSLYEHLGFRVLADEELGPGLRAVRSEEAAHGLDPELRVCMRLDLPPKVG